MPRAYVEGLVLAALFLAIQFTILAWAFLDPALIAQKPLWLHPGLACAAGFTLASLLGLGRRLFRARRGRP